MKERKKERKRENRRRQRKKKKSCVIFRVERDLWGDIKQVVAEGKEQNRKEKRGTTER